MLIYCTSVQLYLISLAPKKTSDDISFKIKTKKRNKYLEEKQHSHVTHHHKTDERNRQLKQQLMYWSILGLWFVLLFWFRAVIQHNPERKQELLNKGKNLGSAFGQLTVNKDTNKDTPAKAPAEAPAAIVPKSEESKLTQSPEQQQPVKPPSLPLPTVLINRLAEDLKKGNIDAAIATISDQSIIFAGKDNLLTTLKNLPDPDTLVANHLKNNIGKPLVMNFKGKPRKVAPKKVTNGKVKLEANKRVVEISIASLSAEQKSLWIDTPESTEEYIVFCILLLQTSNANQATIYADKCGPLEPVIAKATEL